MFRNAHSHFQSLFKTFLSRPQRGSQSLKQIPKSILWLLSSGTLATLIIQSTQNEVLEHWLAQNPVEEGTWKVVRTKQNFVSANPLLTEALLNGLEQYKLTESDSESCLTSNDPCIWLSDPPLALEQEGQLYVHPSLNSQAVPTLRWRGLKANYKSLHLFLQQTQNLKISFPTFGVVRDVRQVVY